MFYHGVKSYPGRWLVRLIQAALIVGIVFYSIDALIHAFLPHDGVIFETTWVEPVEVQVMPFNDYHMDLPQPEYFDLAFDQQLSGQYYAAILNYSRALELDPDLYGAYLNRGVAYERLGRTALAMQDFNQFMNRGVTVYTDNTLYEGGSVQVEMSEGIVYDFVFAARAGQSITAIATSDSHMVDPLLVLVDENGEAVFASDDQLYQDGSLLSMDSYIRNHTITASGLYTLRLSHAGGGSYGDVKVNLQIRND
jgi:tetratricopeptide (TPR) repeat protein